MSTVVKVEIWPQADFKNLEGLTVMVKTYPDNREDTQKMFFKTIQDVCDWVKVNYRDLSGEERKDG